MRCRLLLQFDAEFLDFLSFRTQLDECVKELLLCVLKKWAIALHGFVNQRRIKHNAIDGQFVVFAQIDDVGPDCFSCFRRFPVCPCQDDKYSPMRILRCIIPRNSFQPFHGIPGDGPLRNVVQEKYDIRTLNRLFA